MDSVRSIIFDLDGTLVDSAPAVGAVLNTMRAEVGLAPAPVDAFRNWISLGATELVRRSLEIASQDASARLDDFRQRYRVVPTLPEHLFPSVASTLGELRRRGLRMAICSNKPTALCRKIIDELDLADCFDCVVGSEQNRPAKPDPSALDSAMAAISADPRACIFVGDSSIDQKTAAARGIPFVFFAAGYDDGVVRDAAFRVIGRMDEILDLVA